MHGGLAPPRMISPRRPGFHFSTSYVCAFKISHCSVIFLKENRAVFCRRYALAIRFTSSTGRHACAKHADSLRLTALTLKRDRTRLALFSLQALARLRRHSSHHLQSDLTSCDRIWVCAQSCRTETESLPSIGFELRLSARSHSFCVTSSE